jgi:hypothetical protein
MAVGKHLEHNSALHFTWFRPRTLFCHFNECLRASADATSYPHCTYSVSENEIVNDDVSEKPVETMEIKDLLSSFEFNKTMHRGRV